MHTISKLTLLAAFGLTACNKTAEDSSDPFADVDSDADSDADADADADVEPSFSRVWNDNFVDVCDGCHSASHHAGGLNLDDEATAYASLLDGMVIPGNAEASPLIARLIDDDDEERMPPPEDPRLNTEAISGVREWINTGANP